MHKKFASGIPNSLRTTVKLIRNHAPLLPNLTGRSQPLSRCSHAPRTARSVIMEITITVLNVTQDFFTVAMTHSAGKAASETVPSPIQI